MHAEDVPSPPSDVHVVTHRGCDIQVQWTPPRGNGSCVVGTIIQIRLVGGRGFESITSAANEVRPDTAFDFGSQSTIHDVELGNVTQLDERTRVPVSAESTECDSCAFIRACGDDEQREVPQNPSHQLAWRVQPHIEKVKPAPPASLASKLAGMAANAFSGGVHSGANSLSGAKSASALLTGRSTSGVGMVVNATTPTNRDAGSAAMARQSPFPNPSSGSPAVMSRSRSVVGGSGSAGPGLSVLTSSLLANVVLSNERRGSGSAAEGGGGTGAFGVTTPSHVQGGPGTPASASHRGLMTPLHSQFTPISRSFHDDDGGISGNASARSLGSARSEVSDAGATPAVASAATASAIPGPLATVHPLFAQYGRPEAGPGWHNTGDFVPSTRTSGMLLDVLPGCDVEIRCFALNAHGWSKPSVVSPQYWLPDAPFAEHCTSRSITVSVSTRCPPPLMLQYQLCNLDVLNGSPLEWKTTPP